MSGLIENEKSFQDLAHAKRQLRKKMVMERERLTDNQAHVLSEAIVSQFLSSAILDSIALPNRMPGLAQESCRSDIGLFYAMRQEVDFKSAWQPLRNKGFQLCFPRMIYLDEKPSLEFLAIPDTDDPESCLIHSRFGVREPVSFVDNPKLAPCDPAIILLPGLAFDRAGNRLGWGKGFYDNYLARRLADSRTIRPLLIAAAYSFQILDEIPSGEKDIPVDYLLTPDGLTKTANLPDKTP